MARKAEGPVRTCVGCRRRTVSDRLVRVSLDNAGGLCVGRLGGRGAWLCRAVPNDSVTPRAECLRDALRRGGIERALRRRIGPEALARFASAWRVGES